MVQWKLQNFLVQRVGEGGILVAWAWGSMVDQSLDFLCQLSLSHSYLVRDTGHLT